MRTDYETKTNEEQFYEKLWDEVMFDFFPNASTEEEIADELDNIWND